MKSVLLLYFIDKIVNVVINDWLPICHVLVKVRLAVLVQVLDLLHHVGSLPVFLGLVAALLGVIVFAALFVLVVQDVEDLAVFRRRLGFWGEVEEVFVLVLDFVN